MLPASKLLMCTNEPCVCAKLATGVCPPCARAATFAAVLIQGSLKQSIIFHYTVRRNFVVKCEGDSLVWNQILLRNLKRKTWGTFEKVGGRVPHLIARMHCTTCFKNTSIKKFCVSFVIRVSTNWYFTRGDKRNDSNLLHLTTKHDFLSFVGSNGLVATSLVVDLARTAPTAVHTLLLSEPWRCKTIKTRSWRFSKRTSYSCQPFGSPTASSNDFVLVSASRPQPLCCPVDASPVNGRPTFFTPLTSSPCCSRTDVSWRWCHVISALRFPRLVRVNKKYRFWTSGSLVSTQQS